MSSTNANMQHYLSDEPGMWMRFRYATADSGVSECDGGESWKTWARPMRRCHSRSLVLLYWYGRMTWEVCRWVLAVQQSEVRMCAQKSWRRSERDKLHLHDSATVKQLFVALVLSASKSAKIRRLHRARKQMVVAQRWTRRGRARKRDMRHWNDLESTCWLCTVIVQSGGS